MSRTLLRWLLLVLLPAVLGGCATSPPTIFITLAPGGRPAKTIAYAGEPVVIGRVSLPPELDRRAFVRYLTATRLSVDEQVEWAATLPELVRATLAEDLAVQLPHGKVVWPGALRMPEDKRVLTIVFERFAVGPGPAVTLMANWRLVDRSGRRVLLTRRQQVREPLHASSASAAAQAISRALAQLAACIAKQMR